MTMPLRTQTNQETTAVARSETPTAPAKGGRFTTIAAFACLAALVPWLVCCYISVGLSDPAEWLAALAWLGIFIVGVCVLAFVGTALGLVATFGSGRKGGWGVLALGLNAVLLVVTLTVILYVTLSFNGILGRGQVVPAPVETDR